MKIAFLLLVVFLKNNAFAANNNIILIGGGGEPIGAVDTQFDGSMKALGDFYQKNKDYKTIVNFNGGHSETESLIKLKFSGAEIIDNFTSQSYDKIIEDTIKKLENNQIPLDGKILLFIDSHGSEGVGQTHSIATSNSAMINMSSGSANMVSLDKLKVLSDLAEKKNVKLGIVDGSCHAGHSLKLANSKTCVIAASGPLHYSYSIFTKNFAEKMEKGKNLEELFLETSKIIDGLGFPMISSPIGIAVQNELYPYLTPYMYYHDEYREMPMDKIDKYIADNITPELQCLRDDDYTKLNSIINLVQQLSIVNFKNDEVSSSPDLIKLKKKIAEYKKTQDDYFRKLSQLDLSMLDKVESIRTPDGKLKSSYTHRELLMTDYSFFIRSKKKVSEDLTLNLKKRQKAESLMEFYKICEMTKQRLVNENPDYLIQLQIMEKLKTDENVSREIAFEIMKESNTAYNAYYKLKEEESNKLLKKQLNACKNFIL